MGYTILIVDDSKTVRSVLQRAIDIARVPADTLLTAENGQQALELLEESGIDLLITDIHMPVMTGVELLEALRASERHAKLPAVVISSDSSERRREQLRDLGVHDLLSKPFQPEVLRDVIEAAMGRESDD